MTVQIDHSIYPETTAKKFEALRKQYSLLPPKVPAFYKLKVEEELSCLRHNGGPLYKLVYPTEEKIGLRAPGEVQDYIDDRQYIPKGSQGHFLHKYNNRVLFMPTSTCLGHCMYCFRQDILEEHHEHRQQKLERDLNELCQYLKQHSEVSEVILSGGDPLMLPLKDLKKIFEQLKSISSVQHLRLHTRAFVFDPKSLSSEKISLFSEYRVRFVMHVVHPYELCETVLKKCHEAHTAGLRLYNQFPLLRGVNDHCEVLSRLFNQLDEHHIRNLSVFMPEPVLHSATYRIPFQRIQNIIQQLQNTMPSWIHATRFCQDTPIGKVKLEQRVPSEDPAQVCFERDGLLVSVPDFPKELDVPGLIENLLWKDFPA
jgi:lysine 2,3-aminomutase